MKLSELLDDWCENQEGGPVAVGLHREFFDVEVVAHFTVDGEPQSKARARISMKNGKATAYTPRQTQQAEEAVAWQFRRGAGPGCKIDGESTFGVFAAFFCGTRQRRDVDNMVKLIFDGLTGVTWVDDSQVTEVAARLVRGLPKDQARSEVIVYKTDTARTGGLTGTQPCKRCRKPIRVYPSTAKRIYCSTKCHDDDRATLPMIQCATCSKMFRDDSRGRINCSKECRTKQTVVDLTCEQCGKAYRKPRSWAKNAKYCGIDCQIAAAKRMAIKRARGTCTVCGAGVSRPTTVRCRACFIERKVAS